MAMQNDRLQVEVQWNEGPGEETGKEPEERDSGWLVGGFADRHYVESTFKS